MGATQLLKILTQRWWKWVPFRQKPRNKLGQSQGNESKSAQPRACHVTALNRLDGVQEVAVAADLSTEFQICWP